MDNPLTESFRKLGLTDGDTVLVHSDVTLARRLSGAPNWLAAAKYLHESLRKVVGDAGTIVVPTFTYSWCEGKPWDHRHSVSEVGMYGDYVRRRPDATRSLHPIYSFAADGPDGHAVCDNVSHSSFGKGSVFERLVERNAKLLFFGCSFERCTLVHHAEQMANVPYRFSKWFTGQIMAGGHTYTDSYEMFVRYLDYDVEASFERLLRLAIERRTVWKRDDCTVVRCRDIHKAALAGLATNPCFLLAKAPKMPRYVPGDGRYGILPRALDHVGEVASNDQDITPLEIVRRLYPLNRTLVSDGHDEALRIVGEQLPAELGFRIETYRSTMPVWNWRVPERYVVHEAYLEDEDGNRIADHAVNPLHLVSYSPSVDKWMEWDELAQHLHYSEDRPDAIPWRFRYYERDWGFCISRRRYEALSRRRDKVAPLSLRLKGQ